MNFRKVFHLLIDFFIREEIDYALIGAFAMKAYGYVRATQDIDFLVDGMEQSTIIEYLESLGFKTIYRSDGYSNHAHGLPGLGRIDFVYVKGATAEAIFSGTRNLLILEDLKVSVVSPEHLAALKIFAMKNNPDRSLRDMADIKYLLGLSGTDAEMVKGYFEKYGQLEKFHEITKRNK